MRGVSSLVPIKERSTAEHEKVRLRVEGFGTEWKDVEKHKRVAGETRVSRNVVEV